MKEININEINYSVTNNVIHKTVQKIISNKELALNINGFEHNCDTANRFFILFDTIKFITDPILLKNTVELISEVNFFKIDNQTIEILRTNLDNENYTDVEKTKIKSYMYSILLELILLKKMFDEIYLKYHFKFPEFDCNINTTIISHNIDEIRENCYKMLLKHRTKNCNKNELEKLIDSMIEMDYFNTSNLHENDIKYLQKRLDNLPSKVSIKSGIEQKQKYVPENEQNKVYFKLGLLFAQKKIFSKITTVNGVKTTKYHYENEVFDNPNQLSKRLNLGHQYINDSFKGANTNHNIFKNTNQLKNIIHYCNENKITIDREFLNKYTALVENRQ